MTPAAPDPIEPGKTKLPKWLAVLPALVFVAIVTGRALVQMGQAARAVTGKDTSQPAPSLSCVETYAVTLSNSEFYVPEGQQFRPRQTPQISTVVSGMVRNECGEPLKSVTIPIRVRDDDGKRGEGSVTVSELNPGQAKLFSKAWMGRVTSYEIGKIR
jgi:hypothetical protein